MTRVQFIRAMLCASLEPSGDKQKKIDDAIEDLRRRGHELDKPCPEPARIER